MILDRILADKQIEVEECKAKVSQKDLLASIQNAPSPRNFYTALKNHSFTGQTRSLDSSTSGSIRLIAEVKKASPSKGLIRADFDPVAIARIYEDSGASAISVLTDEKYFQGSLEYLKAVRRVVDIPVLRKDFIVDAYQIYEARAAGADAILLIVAALSARQISEYMELASSLGMASLVEVHTGEELDVALQTGAQIIGVNNRNLQTFETRLETTIELASRVPVDRVLVSESGIFTREDVERLLRFGIDAILVGESLMREQNPGIKVRELLG